MDTVKNENCFTFFTGNLVIVERVMGIEPTFSAWEADVLPLNYTRMSCLYSKLSARAADPGLPGSVHKLSNKNQLYQLIKS